MSKTRKLYAAYGSDLHHMQMIHHCPGSRIVCSGWLFDYHLAFRGGRSGTVTVEPLQGSKVPVIIWSITPADESALDRYEAFPALYVKEDFTIQTDDGPVTAMAYVMEEGVALAYPSPYYLDLLQEGYANAKFPRRILDRAVRESMGR